MDRATLDMLRGDLPDKSCLITIMFEPENDEQAITVKANIDKALNGIETRRYSFQLEQRNKPKPPDTNKTE